MSDSIKPNYFHPQAFLMYAAATRLPLKKADLKPDRSNASVYKVTGKYTPTGVMSSIYNSKNSSGNSTIKDNFFNLEPYKISALVPELRFYKVIGESYVPFYFPISALSEEAVSMDTPSRLGASAVKSFSVNYEGTDPYTSPRYLTANLELYVDNLQNIFAQPPEAGYARLADLFTISIAGQANSRSLPGGATIPAGDLSRPIEVAATLGYSIIDRDIFTREEIQEITESNISLRMNVYSHEINIEQNGSATISIKYTARINNAGRDKMFSAIDSPEDLLARADINQMLKPEKKPANSVPQSTRGDEEAALSRSKKKEEKKILEIRRIAELLDEKKKIYSIVAKEQQILDYATFGMKLKEETSTATAISSSELDEVLSGITANPIADAALSSILEQPPQEDFLNEQAELTKKLSDLDSSKREVYYIAFGDLIQAFFQKVKETLERTKKLIAAADTKKGAEKLKQEGLGAFLKKSKDEKTKITKTVDAALKKLPTFKVLLSDFTYKCYTGTAEAPEELRRMNIADIPISLHTYQKFMYDTLVNSDRNTYVVPQFLESCLMKGGLLDKAMAEWAQAGIARNVISTSPEFTSNTFSGPQLRSSVFSGGRLSTSDVPSPQKAFTAGVIDDECDYYLIYQSPTKELTKDRAGKKSTDKKRGIYHFEIGKNRGLFKNISFSRIDVPFVQEQLMTNQVGMYDELKMIYNANIDMVGNNLFYPGSEIFVDPGSVGFGNPRDMNSAAYRLGLGGYYVVIGVTTSIANGVATTSLTCTHEAHPTDRVDDMAPEDAPKQAGVISTSPKQSSDPVKQGKPDLDSETTESYPQYYRELVALEDSETKQKYLDSSVALDIAKDFRLDPDARRDKRFVGLSSRQEDTRRGSIIYHLVNGRSVKIDPNSDDPVSVVRNSKTVPREGR